MNVVSMVIGLLAIILVAVMSFSFESLDGGNAAEKEKLRRELASLNQRNPVYRPVVRPEPEPVVEVEEGPDPMAEVNDLRQELEELKNEQARAEAKRLEEAAEASFQAAKEEINAAAEAEVEKEEIIPEIAPAEEERIKRRARLIASAIVMGTVEKYYPADGFLTLQINNFNNVQEGVTLAIRRNTGIVGQVKISTVESEKAVADVIPHTFLAGEVNVQPGDELIINP